MAQTPAALLTIYFENAATATHGYFVAIQHLPLSPSQQTRDYMTSGAMPGNRQAKSACRPSQETSSPFGLKCPLHLGLQLSKYKCLASKSLFLIDRFPQAIAHQETSHRQNSPISICDISLEDGFIEINR